MDRASRKKYTTLGLGMLIAFIVVMVIFFMPVFGHGQNGLNYLDNLYNSIAKYSANYLDELQGRVADAPDTKLEAATLRFADNAMAQRAQVLLTKAGLSAQAQDNKVQASGDVKAMLAVVLADTETMFHNNGKALTERYGDQDGRAWLWGWWSVLESGENALTKAEQFEAAKLLRTVREKGVETAYNYYGIEATSIGVKWLWVVGSLLFYVIYTIWYGYAVLFLFEGAGYQLGH